MGLEQTFITLRANSFASSQTLQSTFLATDVSSMSNLVAHFCETLTFQQLFLPFGGYARSW